MLVGRQFITGRQDTDREAHLQKFVMLKIGVASLKVCDQHEIKEGVGETFL